MLLGFPIPFLSRRNRTALRSAPSQVSHPNPTVPRVDQNSAELLTLSLWRYACPSNTAPFFRGHKNKQNKTNKIFTVYYSVKTQLHLHNQISTLHIYTFLHPPGQHSHLKETASFMYKFSFVKKVGNKLQSVFLNP